MQAKGIHARRAALERAALERAAGRPLTSSSYVPPKTPADVSFILDEIDTINAKISHFTSNGFVPEVSAASGEDEEVVITSYEDMYLSAKALLAKKQAVLNALYKRLKAAETAKAAKELEAVRWNAERKDARRMAEWCSARAGAGSRLDDELKRAQCNLQLRDSLRKERKICARRAADAERAAWKASVDAIEATDARCTRK